MTTIRSIFKYIDDTYGDQVAAVIINESYSLQAETTFAILCVQRGIDCLVANGKDLTLSVKMDTAAFGGLAFRPTDGEVLVAVQLHSGRLEAVFVEDFADSNAEPAEDRYVQPAVTTKCVPIPLLQP